MAVAALDAELAYRDAQAAYQKAEVEAAIPRDFRSALDYDRFQGELEKTRLDAELLGKVWQDAEADVKRREQDGELELAKLEADLRYQSLSAGGRTTCHQGGHRRACLRQLARHSI